MSGLSDNWATGDSYETFMGRWSRQVAHMFLEWLDPGPHADWLEVGCGTGALTRAICQHQPASILACDPSEAFVSYARSSILGCPARFLVAGANDLPRREAGYSFIVSGLVLNFLPQPNQALAAMLELTRPEGTVAAYVWDYADGMEFLRIFWDEAVRLDPSASHLDEARRFPLCHPAALADLFSGAGLSDVQVGPLEIETAFPDFEAYWSPFLGGTGPAPGYVASLDSAARANLKDRLHQRLFSSPLGGLHLKARAFAVRGYARA